MGVDINTYHCRVGLFVPSGGCGFMSLFITFGRVVMLLGSLILVRILLLIAGVEQNPGPPDEYIFRYQYLLVEIGTDVMRKIFDVKVGSDFVKHLYANNNKFYVELQKLISANTITDVQAQLLPPKDNSPKSTNFDITLLTCLLRNVCGLLSKNNPVWWKKPLKPTDLSLEADLARLKECRNNLQHSGTVFISKAALTVKWKELSQILNRLNNVSKSPNLSSLINDAKKMDIDEELKQRYDQAIKAWTDMDILCHRGIEELKLGQSEIKDGQSEISQGQSEIKHCQFAITDGQSKMKHGQSEIKDGQSEIKEGQTEIIQGQSEIKDGQSEIKDGQSVLKVGQAKLFQGQSNLNAGQAELKDGQTVFRTGQLEIKDSQSEILQGLSTLNVGQSELQVGLSEIKHDLLELKQGQSELEDQSVLKKSLENVERRQQEQAEHIQEISNTQQVTKRPLGNIEQTPLECKRRRLDMDESDLKHHLLETYNRDCCTLPVSPLYNEEEEDFFQIYQPPTMYQVDYHRTEITEENNRISSYKDIFFKNEQCFQNIYVTGDAGVGKTSLCKCLCLLWCKSQSGGTMEDKDIQSDINFLARFEFVFYISLRDTDCRDVVSMIVDQFYDSDSTEQHTKIENVLRQHKCLVILDAFDEWTPKVRGNKECKIPFRVHSENLVYLTTCRPYIIENVRLTRREIDQHVRVSGIHGTSSESFIEHVVKHMNKENGGNKNAKDFMREVKQCGLYEQVCIPMIASHLVVVWFSQKLTDMSKAFLYGKMLELLFKRAKLRNIESPASSTSELQLPGILSQLRYLKEHVSLLHKLCLLSFRSLFKQDEHVLSLVFTRHQLMSEPYLLSDEEMNFLCKIGILSKNKVIGCFEERKQKLSFLHKSYIEFFAALFVSSFDADNVLNNVAKEWTSVDDVVQFQNFFLLLAGFSYEKVKFLFDSIYPSILDDLLLHRINSIFHYEYYSYREQIKLLQTTLTNCWKKSDRRSYPNTVLQIQDFIFYDDSNDKTLKELLLCNVSCVKSIYSVKGEYYDEFDQIKNLQCLHVGEVLSGDCVKFAECIIQNHSTLQTICIEGDVRNKPLIPELPVRSLRHLTSLSLSDVKMQHNSSHNLVKFLSDNVLIENIKLSSVYCDQNDDSDCTLTLNLPHHTQLTSLCLIDVNILCYNVNKSSLKSITLYTLSERIVSCYIDVFNCIKYSLLLHVDGCNLFDYNTMKTLTCTVKTLPSIKSLKLEWMKLPDDVLLQLHPDVTQVQIMLDEVTMSRQCFHCFIDMFVNNKSVIKVELKWCKITSDDGENHRELSYQESMDYMSEYLTLIPTVNITHKGVILLHFKTASCQ